MRHSILAAGLMGLIAPVAMASDEAPSKSDSAAIEYRVFFNDKKTTPTKESRRLIRELNAILSTSGSDIREVTVEGHASRSGKESGNLFVSRKRAESVSKAMAGTVKANTLRMVAYGSSRLVAELPPMHREQRRANIRIEYAAGNDMLRQSLEALAKKNLSFVSIDERGWREKEHVVFSAVDIDRRALKDDPRNILPANELLAIGKMANMVGKTKDSAGTFVALTLPLKILRSPEGREHVKKYSTMFRKAGVRRARLITRFDSHAEGLTVSLQTLRTNKEMQEKGSQFAKEAKSTAAIRLASAGSVKAIAPFFAKNQDRWQEIEIVKGSNGSEESLRAAFIRQGIPAKKIKIANGFINRQAIVRVSGGSAPQDLQKFLDESVGRLAH